MTIAHANDLVLLISRDHKRFLLRLVPGDRFHSHQGTIYHDDLIGKPLGREILSHLQRPFVVLKPSMYDLVMNAKRASQIIYPKEMGQILLKLDVGPGKHIVEAGTGSGILTMGLAHAIQPGGVVHSYEMREDMLNLARRNVELAGLSEFVRFTQRDIREGFDETDADALFLDVREPQDYIAQACAALADGGFFGALVPTTNQVSALLTELTRHPFASVEVMEILVRYYKPVPARLRPYDQMVGHTGFLIFGRKVALLAGETATAYDEAVNEETDSTS